MSGYTPRVSIGLPVFNGERYLKEALDSLLGQTYKDFELIISDNASSDRTAEICKTYAASDDRIRYYRNVKNMGGCWNQNRVIALSVGKYFLMAHHDDVRAPEYLERVIQILDADPYVVLCYSKTIDIDEEGKSLSRTDPPLNVNAVRPQDRFRDLIRLDHICEPDFGLMRMSVLKRTQLHGNYADSDRVLLAELGLYGPFYQVQECLFFRRVHATQSTARYPSRQERAAWFDPTKAGKIVFPHFREVIELLLVVSRVPLPLLERLACYLALARWCETYRGRLAADVIFALKQILSPLNRTLVPRR